MSAETSSTWILRGLKPRARKLKKTKEEVYERIRDPDLQDTQALKILRNELPWKDWFLTDFLRYWYWLGVFAGVIFLVLEIARRSHVDDVLGASILAMVFVGLVAFAFVIYHKIWVEGAFTRAEAMKRTTRKVLKRKRFT